MGHTCRRHPATHGGGESNIDQATVRSESSQVLEVSTKHVKRTPVEATVYSPLRAQLLEKNQKVLETDEQFIPAGDLNEVLTFQAIMGELRNHELADISYDVFRYAKKIFAVLLVISKLEALRDLIKRGLRDEALPLAITSTGSLWDEQRHSAFSKWDLDARKRFVDFQWTLLAPTFSEGKHLKLHDDTPLPFIRTEPIANGAFGGVHRVEIHSDHERFDNFGSLTTRKVSLKSW